MELSYKEKVLLVIRVYNLLQFGFSKDTARIACKRAGCDSKTTEDIVNGIITPWDFKAEIGYYKFVGLPKKKGRIKRLIHEHYGF